MTVPEMNVLLPAIESYIKLIQTSNVPAIKANGKSKVEKLKKTAEKIKALSSYAKIKTQAEKTLKQAEAKKRRYDELVFGSVLEMPTDDLEKALKID